MYLYLCMSISVFIFVHCLTKTKTMSEFEKLLTTKTTNVRWDLPESTMFLLKGYQKQLWDATGKYPNLQSVVAHIVEYVAKEANDQYFEGIVERKRQEKEALEKH